MHKAIELEIFWGDDDTTKFEKCGMPYKLIDCDTRKMTYYNISAISPYLDTDDNDAPYCKIHCNESEFICVHTYDQVKSIINLAHKPFKKQSFKPKTYVNQTRNSN